MFEEIFRKIQSDLEDAADKEYRARIGEYFGMDVSNYLGVRIPLVRKIGDKYFKSLKATPIDQVLDYCDQLLETRIYEHKVIAFQWSYKCGKQFQKKHFKVFEMWLKKYVDDWSDCDDLSTHSIGYFVYQFPDFIPNVKRWTSSKNRWLRRASAVSLIYLAKRGGHLDTVFETATELLTDPDDLVQKGYGWMLKEASKSDLEGVYNFVLKNKSAMPRTALRYAIEKMPAEYKKAAMQKD